MVANVVQRSRRDESRGIRRFEVDGFRFREPGATHSWHLHRRPRRERENIHDRWRDGQGCSYRAHVLELTLYCRAISAWRTVTVHCACQQYTADRDDVHVKARSPIDPRLKPSTNQSQCSVILPV